MIALFLLAWIGHGYVLMLILNVTFGFPLNRVLLKVQRVCFGWLFFAGPPIVGLVLGFDLLNWSESFSSHFGWTLLVSYAWLCVAAGGVAFPLVTIYRLLRKTPSVVVSETTVTCDVAAELGARPVGNGKHHRVAGFEINDIFKVEFTTLTLAVPGLPKAWHGLSILHLSDLHFYGTPAQAYYEWIMDRCQRDGPADLLVVSGDIIDGNEYIDWIAPVLGRLKWNNAAYAVLGNHDWWRDSEGVRTALRSQGIQVLGNHWQTLDLHGDRLTVIGHEGPWFRLAPDLKEVPPGFRLLVSHTPDNMGWAKRNSINLMLSGHNHGGQIRLPIVGSLFVPSKLSRRYDMGTFHESPTILHVNRGLSGKEPIRFRCRPQVSRIILQCG